MTRRWKRTALTAMAVGLGLLAVVLGRVVLSSRAEYGAGVQAEGKALHLSDPPARAQAFADAIVHYRRAARWYAPGNGYVTRALGRLQAIGRLAEQQDDARTALMAYRAMRRAILGARSFYTPHTDLLRAANARIAALSAREQGRREGADAIAKYEAWHRKQLAANHAPSAAWAVLALLGFLGWVAGAVLFIFRAVTPDDRFDKRQALTWGLLILAGLLIWLVGLTQA